MSKLVLQKYFVVLNSGLSSRLMFAKDFFSVGVKSRAACPASQPVAMSAILAAGTRLSIFSLMEVLTFESLMVMDLLVCLALPKTSF